MADQEECGGRSVQPHPRGQQGNGKEQRHEPADAQWGEPVPGSGPDAVDGGLGGHRLRDPVLPPQSARDQEDGGARERPLPALPGGDQREQRGIGAQRGRKAEAARPDPCQHEGGRDPVGLEPGAGRVAHDGRGPKAREGQEPERRQNAPRGPHDRSDDRDGRQLDEAGERRARGAGGRGHPIAGLQVHHVPEQSSDHEEHHRDVRERVESRRRERVAGAQQDRPPGRGGRGPPDLVDAAVERDVGVVRGDRPVTKGHQPGRQDDGDGGEQPLRRRRRVSARHVIGMGLAGEAISSALAWIARRAGIALLPDPGERERDGLHAFRLHWVTRVPASRRR